MGEAQGGAELAELVADRPGAGTLDAFNGKVFEQYGEHKTRRLMEMELPVARSGDWLNEKMAGNFAGRATAAVVGGLIGAGSGLILGGLGIARIGTRFTGILTENLTRHALGQLPKHYLTEQILKRDYDGSARRGAACG